MRRYWQKFIALCLLGCLAACSSTPTQDDDGPDILLIQMQDFDRGEINRLVNYLKEQHEGLDVLWTGPLDFAPVMYVPARDQYLADEIARIAVSSIANEGLEPAELTTIVLTHKDLNTRSFKAPYVIAAHFDQYSISVVSTARIDPVNYGAAADKQLLQQRLQKLVNKAIGIHHYGYPVVSDTNSVMFGPVTTPAELDQVGDWYRVETVGN